MTTPHTLTPSEFTDRYRLTFNATQENPAKVYMEYRHVKHAVSKAAHKARSGFVTSNQDLKAAKKLVKSDAFLMSCRGMQSGELAYRATRKARELYAERCDVYVREVANERK